MKKVILPLLLCTLTASLAQATTLSGQYVYLLNLNFSGNAFGKHVRSVMAHSGVYRGTGGCGFTGTNYWDGVQDVQLLPVGDHFFGKARVASQAGECMPSLNGPVVQYWVTFDDGSTMQTNPVIVPVTKTVYAGESYMTVEPQVVADDQQIQDISETSATYINEEFSD